MALSVCTRGRLLSSEAAWFEIELYVRYIWMKEWFSVENRFCTEQVMAYTRSSAVGSYRYLKRHITYVFLVWLKYEQNTLFIVVFAYLCTQLSAYSFAYRKHTSLILYTLCKWVHRTPPPQVTCTTPHWVVKSISRPSTHIYIYIYLCPHRNHWADAMSQGALWWWHQHIVYLRETIRIESASSAADTLMDGILTCLHENESSTHWRMEKYVFRNTSYTHYIYIV